jgi:hypothetical protein
MVPSVYSRDTVNVVGFYDLNKAETCGYKDRGLGDMTVFLRLLWETGKEMKENILNSA